jgi:F0F1-type ATP synthase assembly protein I
LQGLDKLCETIHKMTEQRSEHEAGSPMSTGWIATGSFLGSILSGMLLGYLGDRWLGTRPWLIIAGFLLGSYSGFMRLWHYSKSQGGGP